MTDTYKCFDRLSAWGGRTTCQLGTKLRQALVLVATVIASTPAFAECHLDEVVGYTLVAKKTVVAQVQDGKRSNGFAGCQFDRVLAFDDNTGVRCSEYNYEYDLRPTQIVLSGAVH